MHDTAMDFGRKFFAAYTRDTAGLTIVDIGAQDVNGSLRSVAPAKSTYIGVDFIKGKGVDIVLDDPYTLPFEDNSIDACVCSSCFEHSEFFWLLFNEILRILKPEGLLYLNIPSNGTFHRYPVDCWRFYPDSGIALQNWGRRSGYNVALLESFIGAQQQDAWNDFVAVFIKDARYVDSYPTRIQDTQQVFFNGHSYGSSEIKNPMRFSEDQEAHQKLKHVMHSINELLEH